MKKILFLFLALFFAFPLFSQSTPTDPGANPQTMMKEVQDQFTAPLTQSFNKVVESVYNDECQAKQDYVLDLLIPAFLVGFAMILLTLLSYLAGQFLQSQEITRLAKEEFYQSILSIMMGFILISAVFGANSIYVSLNGLLHYDSASIIDDALRTSNIITTQISTDLSVMIFINGILTFISSSTVSFGSFHHSFSVSPGLALKPLTDIVTLSLQFLSVAISEWLFHIVSLCFIKKWAIAVFVPLGMILRAIPYTRDGGSGILSLALCLYVIYPVTFLGMGAVYEQMYDPQMLQAVTPDFISEFSSSSKIFALILLFVSAKVFVPLIVFGAIDTIWLFVQEAVFMFFVMSLILPFFSILITLTATKEISKNFFGADINLSSIIRVI